MAQFNMKEKLIQWERERERVRVEKHNYNFVYFLLHIHTNPWYTSVPHVYSIFYCIHVKRRIKIYDAGMELIIFFALEYDFQCSAYICETNHHPHDSHRNRFEFAFAKWIWWRKKKIEKLDVGAMIIYSHRCLHRYCCCCCCRTKKYMECSQRELPLVLQNTVYMYIFIKRW